MGLKTNKVTKTSRLNCQYVGSFSVSDGDKKLTVAEQNQFVEEKLKNCKKKLVSGMPVCLEVSPDGVRVLANDEKTVKMAHPLRRVSYATAEASNKLFAYVSHQPGTDMEIVCHTFVAKKKDHAEGLSAALGKLFKQAFAYTLKRRDKLEEAAQKRGANRRWAKQQLAEGHSVSPHARNAARNSALNAERNSACKMNQRLFDNDEPENNHDMSPSQRTHEPTRGKAPRSPDSMSPFPPQQVAEGHSVSPHARNAAPNAARNAEPNSARNMRQRSFDNDQPENDSDIASSQGTHQPTRGKAPRSPDSLSHVPLQDNLTNKTPSLPSHPARPMSPESERALVHSPPKLRREPPPRPDRRAGFPEPFVPSKLKSNESTPNLPDRCLLPARSNAPTSSEADSPFTFSRRQDDAVSPALPQRTTLPARSNPPGSFDVQRPSYSVKPVDNIAPALPKRNPSHSTGSVSFPNHSEMVSSPSEDPRVHRKHSAPPDLMPSPLSRQPIPKPRRPSDTFTEAVSPTWLAANAPTRDLQIAASALLAEVSDTPPPLPRRPGESKDQRRPSETGEQRGSDRGVIPEEDVFGDDEDEELRRRVKNDPRVSVTLEDEDWYIPQVSREIVTEMLETSDVGTFFVRDSQSRPGCYALTMKVVKGPNNPTGFGNYLIVPEKDGFALQGFEKVFQDISSLIRHHASYEDGLPCRLLLAGSNPLFHDANGYLVEFMDEEDDLYTSLSSCTSMFKEFEINGNTPW